MSLEAKIRSIESRIVLAQKKSGFNHPVQIIAVTKTHPLQTIKEAYDAGIKSIGENRVQEALQKFESFDHMPKITKRFIGHLQTNKVKKCIALFDTIDSVNSLKLAKKISNVAGTLNRTISVLLEINTSGEQQKHGFPPDLTENMMRCFNEKNIRIKGLMTIAPHTIDKGKLRNSFFKLRELQDRIKYSLKTDQLTELSMGMSGDYEIAIEEGSTMIRLGTILFGKRDA
jgi:pyridoxal phosphate enzyme (YggS family)